MKTGVCTTVCCYRLSSLLPSLPPPPPLSLLRQILEFGKTESKELKPDGDHIPVTEANKREYVQLACQMKMTNAIRSQIKSFLEGFYEIIPKELISIFNEQEMELLICGLPTIDIDDLKANSEYRKYTENSLQVSLLRSSSPWFPPQSMWSGYYCASTSPWFPPQSMWSGYYCA